LENEDADAKMIARIVRRAKFEPDIYSSYRDAERAIQKYNFAAGIFDLRLQDGNGEDAQKIFEDEFGPGVPSMLISGNEQALLKIVQDGVAVIAAWKDDDYRMLGQAIERMLTRVTPSDREKRWTSKEVLLALACMALVSWLTYKACALGYIHMPPKTP